MHALSQSLSREVIMPKFSILVPVYNKLECLGRSFSSIVNQTFDDYEVVVVDDHSTQPGVVEFLKEFAKYDEKIRVYRNRENQGIGTTRNSLLKKATGDYLIFVDSDDYIERDLLETVNEYVDDGVEVVRFQCVSEPATRRQLMIERQKNPYRFCCEPTDVISGEEALSLWFSGVNKINMLPWSYCVKKELYEGLRFPDMRVLEDYPVMPAVVARADKVQAIDYVGYHYMQYDKSLTKRPTRKSQINERQEKLEQLKIASRKAMRNLQRVGVSGVAIKGHGSELEGRILDKEEKIRALMEYETMKMD